MQYNKIAAITKQTLKSLGIHRSVYRGYDYIVNGIILLYRNKDLDFYSMKCLYIDIARECNATVYSVERNVRTVVSNIWDYGNKKILKEIFFYIDDTKPTNREFFEDFYDYIIGQYEIVSLNENTELFFMCPITNKHCEYLCDICSKLI